MTSMLIKYKELFDARNAVLSNYQWVYNADEDRYDLNIEQSLFHSPGETVAWFDTECAVGHVIDPALSVTGDKVEDTILALEKLAGII